MRTFFHNFVMLSVLFLSIGSVADTMSDGHPHEGDLALQADASQLLSDDSSPNHDHEGEHFEHCCHGHVAGISVLPLAPTQHVGARNHQSRDASRLVNHAQAPPTPPPNA